MIPRGMRAAAGRMDRSCRQTAPYSLFGDNKDKYGRNGINKIAR